MPDPYNDPKANREIEDAIERGTEEGKQTLTQFMETSKGRRQAEDALLDGLMAIVRSGVRVNIFVTPSDTVSVSISNDLYDRLNERIDEHNRRHQ